MYKGHCLQVSTPSEFLVIVGLHQGSPLNYYLFTWVMDKLARELHDEIC